jgi:hypothetical protein
VGAQRPEKARHTGLHLVRGGAQEGTGDETPVVRPWRRYPLWRVAGNTCLTLLHYGLGTALLLVAYRLVPALAWPLAASYLVFCVAQRYLFMPLVVCSGCAYLGIEGGRCSCGNNLIAARLTRLSAVSDGFAARTSGALAPHKLDVASFVLPLFLALPGLLFAYSPVTLSLVAIVGVSVVLRMALVEPSNCARCLQRRWCPARRTQTIQGTH